MAFSTGKPDNDTAAAAAEAFIKFRLLICIFLSSLTISSEKTGKNRIINLMASKEFKKHAKNILM